ncbi:hypothetical protein [Sulfurospirillum multivorans]|uniref:Uncharacterized protein n=2 Tax=Sulfurospirillum multivorans TaxID=66821 RepID=A0AA86ALS6_SULMK|nr:hypothetical protein [Sulfurospirillum multivorans]AHJ12961.1 hypothetical protein SMUL_1706 [Sulfurospirillum multivorans DSM 12446]QEH06451.1 hypothetical protein SMN_1686 [Sulfurospirillum multivorans]
MHSFTELVNRCAIFTLKTLSDTNERTIEALQTNGATSLVKTLQMIQLQKVILAVGMFSIFEANLQEGLDCTDGFGEAKKILDNEGKTDLKECFDNLILAINVLKHGRGRSYDTLIAKANTLPFRIKLPDEFFFSEGDVSEVSTLIEVNDMFVQHCGKVINDVSRAIRQIRPEFI